MFLSLLGRVVLIGRLRYWLFDRYASLSLRLLLVGACLSLTLFCTLMLRDLQKPQDVIKGFLPVLLMVMIAGFALIYYNLSTVVIGTVVISTVLADGVSTGTGTKMTFTFLCLNLLAAMWLFKMVVVEKKLTVFRSPANLPAVLFMIVVIIAYVWSTIFASSEVRYYFSSKVLPRLMTAEVLIISPFTYLLFANHVNSSKVFRFIVWWFIVMGFGFLVIRLGAGTVPLPLNAQGQFPTWVVAFCMGQMFFNPKLKLRIRLALALISLGWLYVVLGLGLSWLSGWLPLLLVFFVLVFIYSRKLFLLVLLGSLIIVLTQISTLQTALNEESTISGTTRVGAWKEALHLTEKHWLFGTGPAGYVFYYYTYLRGFFQLSHNNYVDIISQTGLVGFVVFIWFWLAMGIVTYRMARIVPRESQDYAFSRSLIATYICTPVVMMLGDWVTPFPYTQTLAGIDYTIWAWMMAGLTVALYHQHKTPIPATVKQQG